MIDEMCMAFQGGSHVVKHAPPTEFTPFNFSVHKRCKVWIKIPDAILKDMGSKKETEYRCSRLDGHLGMHERQYSKVYALARWYTHSGGT